MLEHEDIYNLFCYMEKYSITEIDAVEFRMTLREDSKGFYLEDKNTKIVSLYNGSVKKEDEISLKIINRVAETNDK